MFKKIDPRKIELLEKLRENYPKWEILVKHHVIQTKDF